ncbi:Protein of unknown function [Cotesia congregata]|uniref:CHK kinase-like domain-containing protein n=1 Tax=Cotesia congregata TaxID=51543 RepID=A0A8J2MPY3_COTCN|nr:Protein of unknown function [Cotesia congregata]
MFRNEIYMYERIIPLFADLESPYIYGCEEEIILRDLRPEASFHATSLAKKLENLSDFNKLLSPLEEIQFPKGQPAELGETIVDSMKEAIKNMELIKKSDELDAAIKFLKMHISDVVPIMKDFVSPPNNMYHVLTHGDCWNNNILFQHDTLGHVTATQFIDYQTPRHVSLALDVHYFLYSSAQTSVINNNYKELIDLYHKSFIENLKKLSVKEAHIKALSLNWLERELQRHSLYGVFTGVWLVGAVFARDENHVDPATEKQKRTKNIVLHYIKNYVP